MDTCSDTLFTAYRLWGDAADRIGAARRAVLDGAAEARYRGLTITADGGIHDDHPHTRMVDEPIRIRELIAKYSGVFRDAIAQASAADAEIAAAFRRLTADSPGVITAASATVPPRGTAPVDVRKWWDSLTPMEQESLLFTRASELGMLDGIPAVIRDRANRFQLVEERTELQAHRQRLENVPRRTREQDAELNAVNDKLGGLDKIETRIHSTRPDQPPAYLLGIDSSGNGRAIVAIGNPDTATNVATFVPGTGAGLGTCGTDIDRADKMLDAANRSGSPSTAAITWIGYDAPQDIVEAADGAYARDARQDLARFQEGLRATHSGPPSHNTVIGHSYGSTVIGHTARDLHINADDVVFVGSPGVGVDNAGQLNLPPERVHATVAETTSSTSATSPVRPMSTARTPPTPASAEASSLQTRIPGISGPAIPPPPTANTGTRTIAHSTIWEILSQEGPPTDMERVAKGTKFAAWMAAMTLFATSCTGSAMDNTITRKQAEDRVEEYIKQAVSVLDVPFRLEPLGLDMSDCDDPTDNGPKGRVFADHVYWIRDVPTTENGRQVAALRKWFRDNGFTIGEDTWDKTKFVSLDKGEDGFRMSLKENFKGELSIGASSPCVWPNGTPEPKS
ncbi:alpha/beta hydrolase [Actinokineospora sp.]|uniref:alpha/beta hydrolase n=1 Tax=Actinokineospora sp. TaxID=1872133 RepID=UPI004037D53C